MHIKHGRLVVVRVELLTPPREARDEGRFPHALVADEQNGEFDLADDNGLLLLLLVRQHHLPHHRLEDYQVIEPMKVASLVADIAHLL